MAESSFQGQAGTIYTRSWEIDRARGGVVLVHGYGEHLGRYEHVAKALNDAGWSAYALDHVGHGRSEGEQVLISDFTPVVEDVHTVVGVPRLHPDGVVPRHSMLRTDLEPPRLAGRLAVQLLVEPVADPADPLGKQ